MRKANPIVAGLATLLLASGARAEAWPRVELERPMSLVVRTTDDRSLNGRIVAYDGEGFEFIPKDGDASQRVAWSDLPADRASQVLERLMDPKDAQAALRLGEMMFARGEDGRPHGERALKRAVALEASLGERAGQIRRGERAAPEPRRSQPEAAPADGEPAAGEEGAVVAPPATQGAVEAAFWGPQPQAAQDAMVAELKRFAAESAAHAGVKLRLYETDYFLFYSDIAPAEAQRWASLLDRMYARLCELFAIPAETNIWRGKCLVLVFASPSSYYRYEQQVFAAPRDEAIGKCWQYGDGRVVITFFRQRDEMNFANVLVHETVHGFIHRYRSPVRVPSVWNEGLAEVIANELVPESRFIEPKKQYALRELRERGGFEGMFDMEHIEGWQYGLASGLTEFMIRSNKRGYVAFVNGIKDGQGWRQSLEQNYGATLDRLVHFYGREIGMRDLRP